MKEQKEDLFQSLLPIDKEDTSPYIYTSDIIKEKLRTEDLNKQIPNFYHPLHVAIIWSINSVEMNDFIELLLENGANVYAEYGKEKRTPLYFAAKYGLYDIAKLLIQKGNKDPRQPSIVNQPNEYGNTPLHCAVFYNKKNIVRLLIDNGAYVNAKNKKKIAPLHIATFKSRESKQYDSNIIELLIQKGADINAEDIDGFTPSYYASSEGKDILFEDEPGYILSPNYSSNFSLGDFSTD